MRYNDVSPWLIGSTHETSPGGFVTPGDGHAIWPDVPHVVKGGGWRQEELRTVEHPLGRIAVIGECLATPDELRTVAHKALETNNRALLAALPGSYTTIVRDEQGSHFIGDAVSQYPVYIRPNGGAAVFSTSTAPLRTGDRAASPDRLSLALGIGMPSDNELQAGRTPLEGVIKTLPQEIVHVYADGRVAKTRHDLIVPDRPLGSEEVSEKLREAMRSGAERRTQLGRRLSADFSGGFDSTSAAYFLARSLDRPLMVATNHSPDVPLDDLGYAQRYLALPESAGMFEHHTFALPATALKYGKLEQLAPGDVPDFSINIRGGHDDYFSFLSSLGSELHVSGIGGDELFDMQPREYLGQFARLSSLPHFIRMALFVARAEKDSPKHVIADSLRYSRFDPQSRIQQAAAMLGRPGKYDSATLARIFGAGSAPHWLTKAMRKEVSEYAASVADIVEVPAGMDAANYRAFNTLQAMSATQGGLRRQAAAHGLRLSSLFYDNDVVRTCLGLPAHKRMDPRVFKQLMGRSFAGIVPTEVTSRKTAGDYTAHAFEGLRKSEGFLRSIMKDSRLADLGIIDPTKMHAGLERAFLGLNTPWQTLDMLIATEAWLRSLDNESWDGATKYKASPTASILAKRSESAASLDGAASFGMPKGVLAVTRKMGGAVVVNMPSGNYHRLWPDDMQVLAALQKGKTVAAAYDELANIYSGVPRHELERHAEACINDLVDKGILSPSASEYAILQGNTDEEAVLPMQMIPDVEGTPGVGLRDYAAACGGLALVAYQKGESIEQSMYRLDKLRTMLAKQPATPQEATKILAAIRRVARLHPNRVACLELSTATALAAALRRRQVDVVLGIRSNPESFHAWPQTGSTPIRTEADEPIAGVYQPLIKL